VDYTLFCCDYLTDKIRFSLCQDISTVNKLEAGYDSRPVQEMLGHKDMRTTMIDTDVINKGGKGVRSPLDAV
jgi:site-specific recombinase XerD